MRTQACHSLYPRAVQSRNVANSTHERAAHMSTKYRRRAFRMRLQSRVFARLCGWSFTTATERCRQRADALEPLKLCVLLLYEPLTAHKRCCGAMRAWFGCLPCWCRSIKYAVRNWWNGLCADKRYGRVFMYDFDYSLISPIANAYHTCASWLLFFRNDKPHYPAAAAGPVLPAEY